MLTPMVAKKVSKNEKKVRTLQGSLKPGDAIRVKKGWDLK